MFTYRSTSSITRRRSVRLSSIAEYSRLQPPVGVWTVRSSIGGDRPLSPPKRRSLGKPLPYQLADTTQAAPLADCSFTFTGLSGITRSFDRLCPTKGDVPTCYYLVRHSRDWTLGTRNWKEKSMPRLFKTHELFTDDVVFAQKYISTF